MNYRNILGKIGIFLATAAVIFAPSVTFARGGTHQVSQTFGAIGQNYTDFLTIGTADINANLTVKATPGTNPVSIIDSSGTNLFNVGSTGSVNQNGDYSHFGSSICKGSLSGVGQSFELCGNNSADNQGVQIQESNNSTGTAAFGGFTLNNDLADNSITHFAGFYLNSSGYSSNGFGTALAVPNLAILQNTDGPLTIVASTSTSPGYINFLTGGTATSSEKARITLAGFYGIGTSTPITTLQIATSSANATTTFTLGKAGQTKGSCHEEFATDGSVVYWWWKPGLIIASSTASCK